MLHHYRLIRLFSEKIAILILIILKHTYFDKNVNMNSFINTQLNLVIEN
jgi:hypothetical protein